MIHRSLALPMLETSTESAPGVLWRAGRFPRVQLASVAGVLPETVRTSREVEAMIGAASPGFRMRPGVIEARTGIVARRVARVDQQCSDLAVVAAHEAMRLAGVSVRDVDLLIFAALEVAWRLGKRSGEPPLTRYAVKNLADSCQLDCSAAREQLGYSPTFSYLNGPLDL